MPIIRYIRNQVSQGISANITSVSSGVRNFPTMERQPDFARTFEYNLQSRMNNDSIDYSCFVFPDSDIRTSQFVGSCGSAAITVAMRHLHPQRIGQTGKWLQPTADFDFVFESTYNASELTLSTIIGHEFDRPFYRGRPGYVLWNQMTYYALTNNQIGSFLQLFNKDNATNFRLYLHTESTLDSLEFKESRVKRNYNRDSYFLPLESTELAIEDRLCEILERNHLPIVLVDGLIWSHGNHYTFPNDEEEWKERATNNHTRPEDCTVIEDHPALAELKELMNDNHCWEKDSQENHRSPINDELCHDLHRTYEHLKNHLESTTIGHAVVITGFYVRRAGGDVLWRVIDSNPSTKLNKLRTRNNRDLQGSVNFMTTKEIVSRMTGEGRRQMILEMTSRKNYVRDNFPDQRNLIVPVSLDNNNGW